MFVRDIMTRNPAVVSPDATLNELVSIMIDRAFEAVPVVENGKLVGIVTDWDVVTNMPREGSDNYLNETRVKDIMWKGAVSVAEDEIVEMAAYHMYFHDMDALPVVDSEGNVIAVVTQNDVFRTLVGLMGLRARGTRITLDVPDEAGVLAEITDVFRREGVSIASLSTVSTPGSSRGLVILRVRAEKVDGLLAKLPADKFKVVHVSRTWE